jgi:hypothetical protein
MSEIEVRKPNLQSGIFPDGFWRITGIIMGSIALIILVWGFFHARAKVPYPADSRLEFPIDSYATASERFSEPSGCQLLDQAYFTKKAIAMLGQEMTSDPVRELLTATIEELREKLVVVRKGHNPGGNFQVLYEGRKAELEQAASSLESQIESTDYYSGQELREQLRKTRIQSSGLEGLKSFLSGLDLKCDLGELPYTDNPPDIQMIGGFLMSVTRDAKFRLRDAAPVLEKSFLTKAGIPAEALEGIDLDKDKESWEELLSEAKKKHKQETQALRAEIDRQVSQRREAVRNEFYSHWLGLLLMAFSTLCTYFALKRYYRIISRKGLPRKSSFEIYFATNMTSQILRWLALVIVVIGMIQLWGFLLLQILQGESEIPLLPLFNLMAGIVLPSLMGLVRLIAAGNLITTFLFCLLAPVALGLLTVLQSWFVLLLSEFICFVSNCYHVLYNMAHPSAGQASNTK